MRCVGGNPTRQLFLFVHREYVFNLKSVFSESVLLCEIIGEWVDSGVNF